MSKPPVTVPASYNLNTALEVMERNKVRRLPVVTRGALVGIITKSDILAQRERDGTVADVMKKTVLTVPPDETIEAAAQLMLQRKISGVPVVEEGKLVGMITESDVFRAIGEMLGLAEKGARIAFSVDEDDDLLKSIESHTANLALRSLATYRSAADHRWHVVARVRGRTLAKQR
jgi:acetoin utilization protein AcuB